jgi:hypothetical protein
MRVNQQPPRKSYLVVGLTFCYCLKEFLQYLSLLKSGVPKPFFGCKRSDGSKETRFFYREWARRCPRKQLKGYVLLVLLSKNRVSVRPDTVLLYPIPWLLQSKPSGCIWGIRSPCKGLMALMYNRPPLIEALQIGLSPNSEPGDFL